MSYALGALSLVWLLFSAVSIELMLNENCAYGVLGAQTANDDGKILTPGQLLPMVIGAFSFVKLLYNIFENWRDPRGASPSLGREPSRRQVKGTRRSRNPLKFFSPRLAEEEDQYSTQENRSEEREYRNSHPFQRMNFFMRILITLIPHISLFWSWPWSKGSEGGVVDRDDDSTKGLYMRAGSSADSPPMIRKDSSVTWSKSVDVQLQERELYDEPVDQFGRVGR